MDKPKKGFLYAGQMQLFGKREIIGFYGPKLTIKEVDRNTANEIIIKNHYSGKFYSASYIHLAAYIDEEMVGVLQFGYAMNPASMSGVVNGTGIKEYLELNRMWFKDGLFKNIKSMALGYSFKYIKRKYPRIKWVQSFADERCNKFGIVYQASNFTYHGEHESIFWELDGTWYHNILATAKRGKQGSAGVYLQENIDRAQKHKLRQFRYLYFLNKSCKKDCLLKEQPPPKHYNGD